MAGGGDSESENQMLRIGTETTAESRRNEKHQRVLAKTIMKNSEEDWATERNDYETRETKRIEKTSELMDTPLRTVFREEREEFYDPMAC